MKQEMVTLSEHSSLMSEDLLILYLHHILNCLTGLIVLFTIMKIRTITVKDLSSDYPALYSVV